MIMPLTSIMPMLLRAPAPGPVASTSGKWPTTVAAVGGVQVNGNAGLAGKHTYRDGVNQNNDVGAGTGTAGQDMELLCSNWVGTPHGGQHATEVIAFAIYSATLTDAQMAAVAAAMAAL